MCAMFVKESTRVVGTVVCSSKRPMMKPSSRIRMLEPIAVMDGIASSTGGPEQWGVRVGEACQLVAGPGAGALAAVLAAGPGRWLCENRAVGAGRKYT